MTKTDIKIIYVDLQDRISLKRTEFKKRKLENEGYSLLSEDVGFLTASFTYKKDYIK